MREPDAADAAARRFTVFLRARYLDARAKRIALDCGIDKRTAESWLAGNLPQTRQLARLCWRWGPAFCKFVMIGPAVSCDSGDENATAGGTPRALMMEAKAVAVLAELHEMRRTGEERG